MSTHAFTQADPTVLVVASGKGGTGVSLVSALLGLAMAEEGRRVLLVDGTDSYGALHVMLGVAPRHRLAELRGGTVQAEELLTPVTDLLTLLPGGADEAGAAPLSTTERQVLSRRARELFDGFDLVVVDAGSRLDAVLGACGDGVEQLLIVATDDQITMAASHALLKAVDARLPGLAVNVVVNRADDAQAIAVHDHLSTAAAQFLGREVGHAGALPHDHCLQAAMGAGMTVQDAAAGSPAAIAARDIGMRLVGPDAPRAAARIA